MGLMRQSEPFLQSLPNLHSHLLHALQVVGCVCSI